MAAVNIDVPAQYILIAAACSGLAAQVLKVLWYFPIERKINFRRIVETGGMPSSHTSTVVALATTIGIHKGWGSVEFAIAAIFSSIVMYDAAGVRRAAGRQARVLNMIVDELYETAQVSEERLKELLGHTPMEVLGGAVFGFAFAYLFTTIR